jgi:hypothetical protein
LAGIRIYLNSRVSGDWVTNSLTAENIFGVHTRLSKENYKIHIYIPYIILKIEVRVGHHPCFLNFRCTD